jgi:hypothetical protein
MRATHPLLIERDDTLWLIPTPGADETLRSVLQRAGDLYARSPEHLWRELHAEHTDAPSEIDHPSWADLDRLAHVLAVSRTRLARLRLPDGEGQLATGRRHAYCPACWRDDDAAGRPRHFRRAWAGVFTLRCGRHQTPLFLWHAAPRQHAPRRGDDISLAEMVWKATAASPEALASLQALEDVARVMDACRDDPTRWPAHWLGNAAQARALLIEVMTIDERTGGLPIASAQANARLQTLIHSGPVAAEAGATTGWERLRQTRDPAVRRMALWLVGSWLVPTWPAHFRSPLPPPHPPAA